MSTDNIRIFLQRVAEDAALQEQIKALAGQDAAQAEAAVMKLAAEQGLPFTAEELQAFAAEEAKDATERGDLSDSELEQVAGGIERGEPLGDIIYFLIDITSKIFRR